MSFDVQHGTRGDLKTLLLLDSDSGARVEIVPERGALATAFSIGKTPVLFLDEATLLDRTRNVRGGIPVLFPIAGKLPNDSYAIDGTTYALPQHGFARRMPWQLAATKTEGEAAVTLKLTDTDETRAVFPFRFEALLTFSLTGRTLLLTFEVANRDARPLPLHLGFHPYFHVERDAKADAHVETNATRAFDNRTGQTGPLPPLDFTADELDQHLLDHGAPQTVLERPPLSPITLRFSPEFRTLVLWTLKGRDFICVEPWTAPGGALSSFEGLLHVPPGERRALFFSIEAG